MEFFDQFLEGIDQIRSDPKHCGNPTLQSLQPVALSLSGDSCKRSSKLNHRNDALSDGIDRGLEPWEKPFRPKLNDASAIDATISLHRNRLAGKIEEPIHEPMPPYSEALAFRATLRSRPIEGLQAAQQKRDINRKRYNHGGIPPGFYGNIMANGETERTVLTSQLVAALPFLKEMDPSLRVGPFDLIF